MKRFLSLFLILGLLAPDVSWAQAIRASAATPTAIGPIFQEQTLTLALTFIRNSLSPLAAIKARQALHDVSTPIDYSAPGANRLVPMLEATQTLDDSVEGLTIENFDAEKHKISRALETENHSFLPSLQRRLTADGRHPYAVLEAIENTLLGEANETDISLVALPLTQLNGFKETFGLEGFSDLFMGTLRKNFLETQSPKQTVTAGYVAGRLLLHHVDPEKDKDYIRETIQNTVKELKPNKAFQEIIKAHALKYGKSPKDLQNTFEAELSELPIRVTHQHIRLQPETATPSGLTPFTAHDEFTHVDRPLEVINVAKWSPDLLDLVTNMEEKTHRETYDAEARRLSAMALDAKQRGDRKTESEAIEGLLWNTLQSLSALLHVQTEINRIAPKALSQMPEYTEDNPRESRVTIFTQKHLNELEALPKKRDELLSQDWIYDQLEMGRKSALPVFNVEGKLPRPLHWLKGTLAADLGVAWQAFQRNPQSTNKLRQFKEAYDLYRAEFLNALLLSYRDARLPEIYSLNGIEDVLQAEDSGAWVKAHERLEALATQLQHAHGDQIERWHKTASLHTRGGRVFLVKRLIGDEILTLFRTGQAYVAGFAEFNKGSSYFERYTPDASDTTYHKILRAFYDNAVGAYVPNADPLTALRNYLGTVDDVLQRVAPEPFQTHEKVGTEKKRLPLYQDSRGRIYAHDRFESRWLIKATASEWKEVTLSPEEQNRLTAQQAHLSAARTYWATPVPANAVWETFNRLDALNAYQKKNSDWIHKVKNADEILSDQALQQNPDSISEPISDHLDDLNSLYPLLRTRFLENVAILRRNTSTSGQQTPKTILNFNDPRYTPSHIALIQDLLALELAALHITPKEGENISFYIEHDDDSDFPDAYYRQISIGHHRITLNTRILSDPNEVTHAFIAEVAHASDAWALNVLGIEASYLSSDHNRTQNFVRHKFVEAGESLRAGGIYELYPIERTNPTKRGITDLFAALLPEPSKHEASDPITEAFYFASMSASTRAQQKQLIRNSIVISNLVQAARLTNQDMKPFYQRGVYLFSLMRWFEKPWSTWSWAWIWSYKKRKALYESAHHLRYMKSFITNAFIAEGLLTRNPNAVENSLFDSLLELRQTRRELNEAQTVKEIRTALSRVIESYTPMVMLRRFFSRYIDQEVRDVRTPMDILNTLNNILEIIANNPHLTPRASTMLQGLREDAVTLRPLIPSQVTRHNSAVQKISMEFLRSAA